LPEILFIEDIFFRATEKRRRSRLGDLKKKCPLFRKPEDLTKPLHSFFFSASKSQKAAKARRQQQEFFVDLREYVLS
jgi:hypothetical protein